MTRGIPAVVALAAIATGAGCSSKVPSDFQQASGAGGAETQGGAGGTSASAGVSAEGGTLPGGSSQGGSETQLAGSGGENSLPNGKVPMFVAQGDMGRTVVSCDDGNSWVGDHAWDVDGDPLVCGSTQPGVCYEGQCSYLRGTECVQATCCDHSSDVSKGVIYGSGRFVATWGWGQPGAVRSSSDGISWTTTLPNDSFGGIAFGAGRFVVASRTPFWSSDGSGWTAAETADFRNVDGTTMWSVRRFAYADYQGEGRFIAVASGDTDRDMLVSSDGGQTWWRPSEIPADCALEVSTYGGIVSGNDVIVIVDQQANACRSSDGGVTWSVSATGLTQVLSHGVWNGTEFVFWGDDSTMISSRDGATWTQQPMATPIRLGPVARGPTGTLVGLNSVWDGYERQQFWRSEDGLTWIALPEDAFAASHPIFYLSFGYAEPSETCPAP